MQHLDAVEQLRSALIPQVCARCRARTFGICQAVQDEDLLFVKRYSSGNRTVRKGQHLYHEGERTDEIYSLVEGWVSLYHLLPDGRRQILEFTLPGALLGYQPDRLAPMTHSAQSITPVTVCVFPKARFGVLLREHPEIAVRMVHICASHQVLLHQHLTNLGRRNGIERMAHFLLEFILRLEEDDPTDATGTVSLPLTQEELGDTLGLSRVRVNRILGALQKRGLVDLGRGVVKVRGPIELARMAGLSAVEEILGPMRPRHGRRAQLA